MRQRAGVHGNPIASLVAMLAVLSACSPGETPSAESSPMSTTPSDASSAPVTPTPSPRPEASPTSSPAPQAGTYLALGDSLAVGVGASDPARLGYVGRIHRALGGPALRNLAVSGETSASFREGGQLTAALEAIRSADPPVSLVTLDIGGNDLLRLLGSEPCMSQPDSAACGQAVAATLAAFERNYRAIVGELRAELDRTAPGARLAVMTYFNPFSGTDAVYEAGGRLALLGNDLELDCRAADRDLADRGMNDIIACVGRRAGAAVADVHPRFVGQGLDLTHIGSEDIHANDQGYAVIAETFVRALPAGSAE
ncbi:MAG TPA: GDSL-type esterase/lipase family protein [Candidatus Limnocylindria bacterium]|nr:GDSL-type esterase/lipase family protein [Candidatus Limnocylindria bacterium]